MNTPTLTAQGSRIECRTGATTPRHETAMRSVIHASTDAPKHTARVPTEWRPVAAASARIRSTSCSSIAAVAMDRATSMAANINEIASKPINQRDGCTIRAWSGR